MSDQADYKPSVGERLSSLPIFVRERIAVDPTRTALNLWDARQSHAAECRAEGEQAERARIVAIIDEMEPPTTIAFLNESETVAWQMGFAVAMMRAMNRAMAVSPTGAPVRSAAQERESGAHGGATIDG